MDTELTIITEVFPNNLSSAQTSQLDAEPLAAQLGRECISLIHASTVLSLHVMQKVE